MPNKQHLKMDYNLFGLRHNLINEDLPTVQERLALEILEQWYDGLTSEVTTVNKLIKIGVLNNE